MKLLILMAALLMLHPAALADATPDALLEQAGFSRLAALSGELGGPDAKSIARSALSGELIIADSLPSDILKQLGGEVKRALTSALSALAAPVIVTLALRMIMGEDAGALTLLCRLGCVYSLGRQCAWAIGIAESGMGDAARIADIAAPVVAAALSLTGRAASAAALTPLAAICVDAIQNALIAWGLPLCGVAAVVAAGGSLSDHFRMDRLFKLVCGTVTWGAGLLIAAFVGMMTLEGRLAASRDGVSTQALRQALRGLIPYIGGSVSDSSGALLESALSVRNAVGVTGLMIALYAAVKPALSLSAHMLSLKLASALIEPVADPGVVRVTACYGEISRALLALYAGSTMLSALLIGAGAGLMGF